MNIPKIILSSREITFSIFILFALVYFLFDYSLYEPKRKEAQKIKSEIESIDGKIQEDFKDISNPAGIPEEIALLDKKVKFLKEKYSGSESPGKFIQNLAGLCKKLKIEMVSLNPRETDVSALEYRQVFIEMDLRCNFKTIAVFMKELTSLNCFSTVDTLNIQGDAGPARLKFHLVIQTFFPREKKQEISLQTKKQYS